MRNSPARQWRRQSAACKDNLPSTQDRTVTTWVLLEKPWKSEGLALRSLWLREVSASFRSQIHLDSGDSKEGQPK